MLADGRPRTAREIMAEADPPMTISVTAMGNLLKWSPDFARRGMKNGVSRWTLARKAR